MIDVFNWFYDVFGSLGPVLIGIIAVLMINAISKIVEMVFGRKK